MHDRNPDGNQRTDSDVTSFCRPHKKKRLSISGQRHTHWPHAPIIFGNRIGKAYDTNIDLPWRAGRSTRRKRKSGCLKWNHFQHRLCERQHSGFIDERIHPQEQVRAGIDTLKTWRGDYHGENQCSNLEKTGWAARLAVGTNSASQTLDGKRPDIYEQRSPKEDRTQKKET